METAQLMTILVDEGSVLPVGTDDGCGVTAAFATVSLRPVTLLLFGAVIKGARAAQTIERLLEKTLQTGTPLLMVFTENETADDMEPLLSLIPRLVRLSGVCPILSLSLREEGAIAKSFSPYADFRIYSDGLHENTASDIQTVDVPAAIEKLRSLLFCLPLNCAENAPVTEYITAKKSAGQQNVSVLQQLADNGSSVEIYKDSDVQIVFARICGKCTGLISTLSGKLPHHAARFIQLCDCYSLPFVIVAEEALVLSPLQMFVLSQATTPKLLIGQAATGTAAFDFVFDAENNEASTLREKTAAALACMSVKRDVLPPHKHGNLPI